MYPKDEASLFFIDTSEDDGTKSGMGKKKSAFICQSAEKSGMGGEIRV